VQKAPEGGYSGQCVELPGAISEGETLEELKKNMTETKKARSRASPTTGYDLYSIISRYF
jgi:hypothetical protein